MSDVPPEAVEAAAHTAMQYEPDAAAALLRSPSQLLSVLAEMSRRAVEAAAPAIVSAARLAHAREHAAITAQAVRTERNRIADRLRGILVVNVILPQSSADAVYGLLSELEAAP